MFSSSSSSVVFVFLEDLRSFLVGGEVDGDGMEAGSLDLRNCLKESRE